MEREYDFKNCHIIKMSHFQQKIYDIQKRKTEKKKVWPIHTYLQKPCKQEKNEMKYLKCRKEKKKKKPRILYPAKLSFKRIKYFIRQTKIEGICHQQSCLQEILLK